MKITDKNLESEWKRVDALPWQEKQAALPSFWKSIDRYMMAKLKEVAKLLPGKWEIENQNPKGNGTDIALKRNSTGLALSVSLSDFTGIKLRVHPFLLFPHAWLRDCDIRMSPFKSPEVIANDIQRRIVIATEKEVKEKRKESNRITRNIAKAEAMMKELGSIRGLHFYGHGSQREYLFTDQIHKFRINGQFYAEDKPGIKVEIRGITIAQYKAIRNILKK